MYSSDFMQGWYTKLASGSCLLKSKTVCQKSDTKDYKQNLNLAKS